jgi:hypothetical protein
VPRIHRYAEHAIFDAERFAITADVWCSVRDYLAGFTPLCTKDNPEIKRTAALIWQLAKGHGSEPRQTYLIVSLLFTGFFNRSFCDCSICLSIDLNRMPKKGT